jgi:hypothetical protein
MRSQAHRLLWDSHMNNKSSWLLTSLAWLALAGCGTMYNARMKTYELEPGVLVDGESGTATLDQQLSHDVEYTDGSASCEMKSEPGAGYVILDVLAAGLVGVVVDAITDDWKVLSDCRGVVPN